MALSGNQKSRLGPHTGGASAALFSSPPVTVPVGGEYSPVFEIDNLGIATEPTAAALKTNTRTSAATAFDHEGVLVTGEPYEIMLKGGRRERNSLLPAVVRDFSNAGSSSTGWLYQYAGITYSANAETDKDGNLNSADTIEVVTGASPLAYINTVVFSGGSGNEGTDWTAGVWLKGLNGTTKWTLNWFDGTHRRLDLTLTSEWKWYPLSVSDNSNALTYFYAVDTRSGHMDSGTFKVAIDFAMAQNVTGRSNKSPSEWLDPGVDYGYGVNGVCWYDTTNGNSVTGNVVTEAAGADIYPVPQPQQLPARTNAVVNNTFSEIASATDFDDWTESVSGTSTATQETSDLPAGYLTGLRLDVDGSKSNVYLGQVQRLSVGAGGVATLSAQIKAASANGFKFGVRADDGAGGSIEYLNAAGSAWQAGVVEFAPSDLPTSWAHWEYTLPATNTGRTHVYLRTVVRNGSANETHRITGLQLEPGTEATPTIITTTAAVARAKDEIQIADFDTWANATEGVSIVAITDAADWSESSESDYLYGGASAKFAYRAALADGLSAYDGTGTTTIENGHTPDAEVLVATIWSATLNKLVLGYTPDGGTTWHWDPTPAAFSALTLSTVLTLGKTISEPYTMRGATMFDGLPPGSDATLGDVQDWVEGIAPLWPYIPPSGEGSGTLSVGSISVGSIYPASIITGSLR